MKLYTEEQVKDMLELTNLNVQFHIDTMIPIELPSDEEIKQHLTNKHSKALNPPSVYYRIGFKAGAKWMKEQILNQNK